MAAPPTYSSAFPNAPPGYGPDKDKKGAGGAHRPETGGQTFAFSSTPSAVYACVLLSSSDRLRLLQFPDHIPTVVQGIIQHAWPPGIQAQQPLTYGGYEFKIRGRPWWGQGSEAVPARRLLIHLLHGLAYQGWHLAASTDLSKGQSDKDTLFFRAGPPIPRVFFSVSFNESDKVRLIDPPNEAVKVAFLNVLQTPPARVQESKEKEYGCTQVKLRGNPWLTSSGREVSEARLIALNLLTAMDNLGYELAGSIDMSAGTGEHSSDLDSWFFANKIM